MTDADLEYAGRERKRPPGASDLVQQIYMLLDEHPEGMARDEIHAVLRDGWLETDAYRAYDRWLVINRKPYAQAPSERKVELLARGSGQYGTDDFKRRAQLWWLGKMLTQMVGDGTVRREGPHGKSRWYVGHRAPRVVREGKTRYYAPLDVTATRAANQADTQGHVRREQVKARFLADLNDPELAKATRKNTQRLLETIRLGYEYLSGR